MAPQYGGITQYPGLTAWRPCARLAPAHPPTANYRHGTRRTTLTSDQAAFLFRAAPAPSSPGPPQRSPLPLLACCPLPVAASLPQNGPPGRPMPRGRMSRWLPRLHLVSALCLHSLLAASCPAVVLASGGTAGTAGGGVAQCRAPSLLNAQGAGPAAEDVCQCTAGQRRSRSLSVEPMLPVAASQLAAPHCACGNGQCCP